MSTRRKVLPHLESLGPGGPDEPEPVPVEELASPPFVKFWPDRFFGNAEVRAWPGDLRSLYMHLLVEQASCSGYLPADEKELGRLLGYLPDQGRNFTRTQRRWRRVLDAKFRHCRRGLWHPEILRQCHEAFLRKQDAAKGGLARQQQVADRVAERVGNPSQSQSQRGSLPRLAPDASSPSQQTARPAVDGRSTGTPEQNNVDSMQDAAHQLVLEPVGSTKVAARMRKADRYTDAAKRIGNYWKKQTDTTLRSVAVARAIVKRLVRHLRDGWTEEQLKLCVDRVLLSAWHVERKLHKRPEVIWRDAVQIQGWLEGRPEAEQQQSDADREARNQRALEAVRRAREELDD